MGVGVAVCGNDLWHLHVNAKLWPRQKRVHAEIYRRPDAWLGALLSWVGREILCSEVFGITELSWQQTRHKTCLPATCRQQIFGSQNMATGFSHHKFKDWARAPSPPPVPSARFSAQSVKCLQLQIYDWNKTRYFISPKCHKYSYARLYTDILFAFHYHFHLNCAFGLYTQRQHFDLPNETFCYCQIVEFLQFISKAPKIVLLPCTHRCVDE